MLAFDERGKPKYLEKTSWSRKRAYNELNPDMVRRWDSTLRHTGGREVIPPVHHPGSHSIHIELAGLKALLLTSKLNRHCLIFT